MIHHTGSLSIEGTISWFRQTASGVSAHYVVGRDGRVVQMVDEAHVAWHAGRSAMFPHEKPPREPNVNDFSLGIELVGTNDQFTIEVKPDRGSALVIQRTTPYVIGEPASANSSRGTSGHDIMSMPLTISSKDWR